MDQFIRYYFVYCCYVPNELCHCTNYSGLYCITLCFHQIKKTRCKLGFIYTISTFHHCTQICPISDKSWRSCQKFQVQWHLCAQMLSWLEFQLKGNPWLYLVLKLQTLELCEECCWVKCHLPKPMAPVLTQISILDL
jgi:hypothetical protein